MDSYLLVSTLLNELAVRTVMKKGVKRIGGNLKRDPTSAAYMLMPHPGAVEVGLGMHMLKNKGSRNTAKTMVSKVFNPNRKKAAERMADKLKKDKSKQFSKYLGVSKTLS